MSIAKLETTEENKKIIKVLLKAGINKEKARQLNLKEKDLLELVRLDEAIIDTNKIPAFLSEQVSRVISKKRFSVLDLELSIMRDAERIEKSLSKGRELLLPSHHLDKINMNILLSQFYFPKEYYNVDAHNFSNLKTGFIEALGVIFDYKQEDYLKNIEKGQLLFHETFSTLCSAQGNRIYTIRDNVVDELIQTSIDESLSCDLVRAPEPGVVYIELGEKKYQKDIVLDFNTGLGGRLRLDGFYVCEEVFESKDFFVGENKSSGLDVLKKLNLPVTRKIRTLSFNFCSTIDDEGVSFEFETLYIPVPENESDIQDLSFLEVFNKHVEFYWDKGEGALKNNKSREFCSLVMLYISSQSYREKHSEFSDLNELIKKSSNKKRSKLINKSMGAVDRIYVSQSIKGIDKEVNLDNENDELKRKKAHYRKGYIRQQRYGKGFGQIKLVWIRPVIVNSNQGNTLTPKNHVYGKKSNND